MSRRGKPGRPTKFTRTMGNKICDELRNGKTLRMIAAMPDMPSPWQIMRWKRSPTLDKFRQQYELALQERAESWEHEIIDIAEDGTNDYMEILSDEGEVVGYKLHGEAIKRSELRVNTRKWLMQRRAAKIYGDKSAVDLTNSDRSLRPVQVFNMKPVKSKISVKEINANGNKE